MKIFLDTRDIINLFEKNIPCSVEFFRNKMSSNGHQLVLSFASVMEIVAPLLQKNTSTSVMRLLNHIESVPVTFIKANTSQLELAEAIRSYCNGTEYCKIHPFVSSFAEVPIGHPENKHALKMSLSEVVFGLWTHSPDILKGFNKYHAEMIRVLNEDRTEEWPPSLGDHFAVVVARHLKKGKFEFPRSELRAFAQWIYDNPLRCPGFRLGYEVYHKLRYNKTDKAKTGDIADFSHVDYLPYVDMITLDRRMTTYTRQAWSALGVDYGSSLYNTAEDILSKL